MLRVTGLTVRYGPLTVLAGVDFSLAENEWLMVVGPNGAGKSTVVNAISQSVPYSGQVLLRGQPAARMKPAQLARHVGVLGQTRAVAYAFTVGEIVRMGRYAHAPGLFSHGSDGDDAAVRAALQATGMAAFEHKSVLTLSGGELQRAFLAQVFAQDPDILLLDEPTNHLDLVYQKQIFDLIGHWVKQPGKAVLSVVHDLALARAFGARALLLNGGRVAAQGHPDDVLTPAHLQSVYQMDVHGWMQRLLSGWAGETTAPPPGEQ